MCSHIQWEQVTIETKMYLANAIATILFLFSQESSRLVIDGSGQIPNDPLQIKQNFLMLPGVALLLIW